MKNLLLISIFSILLNCLKAQTSAEEYNYITKGYQRVITESADVKRGYQIVKTFSSSPVVSTWGNKNYFEFQVLKKEGADTASAYIIIHYMNNTIQKVYCLPALNSDNSLLQDFEKNIDLLATNQKTMLIVNLAQLYAWRDNLYIKK